MMSQELIKVESSKSSILNYSNPVDSDNKLLVDVLDDFLNIFDSNHTTKAYKIDIKNLISKLAEFEIITVDQLKSLSRSKITSFCQNIIKEKAKYDQHQTDKVTNSSSVRRYAYSIGSFFNYLSITAFFIIKALKLKSV